MRDGWTPSGTTYEKPNLGDYAEDDPYMTADLTLTAGIAAVIEQHYPGHPWLIQVTHKQRIVKINLPLLMGSVNWYVIPIEKFKTDPGMKCVVEGCGEILERYEIPRNAFSRDHYLAALHDIPPYLRGTHGHIPS